ncbi:nitrogenase-stabilizing/protective protein NifW [Amycolatopsis sp. OK19-0408]|uniref:Nitrogenase-stabilizing/protective protein NifW n=1 Tax=Amycolatopsis iheyensis TaxID=2945988 RepID=A0A9X2NJ08_9PSEU|nr:nitrogenase-stabilizing/protective protein NifW [Amycolatopsis iheyensis]MCR6488346.1 nitrogenase-stabilizing/protective protein NifW [Amycolatopsis iheyensis]
MAAALKTTSASSPSSPPRAAAVVRAFTTTPSGGYQHPVLAAASALATANRTRAQVHRVLGDPDADAHAITAAIRAQQRGDAACAALIDRIDRWGAVELPQRRTGVLHTESLGQLIERLVIVWMRGQLLAEDRHEPADPQVRLAARQLGELARAYDDLVTDLLLGRRQLPVFQTSAGPDGMA